MDTLGGGPHLNSAKTDQPPQDRTSAQYVPDVLLLREKGKRSKTTCVVTAHVTSPDILRRRSVSYALLPRVTRTWPATRTACWRPRRATRRHSDFRAAIGDLHNGAGNTFRRRLAGI